MGEGAGGRRPPPPRVGSLSPARAAGPIASARRLPPSAPPRRAEGRHRHRDVGAEVASQSGGGGGGCAAGGNGWGGRAVSRWSGLRCRVSLGLGDRSLRAAGGGRLSSELPRREHRGGPRSTGTARRGGAERSGRRPCVCVRSCLGSRPPPGLVGGLPGHGAAGGGGGLLLPALLRGAAPVSAVSEPGWFTANGRLGSQLPCRLRFLWNLFVGPRWDLSGRDESHEWTSCVLQTGDCQPALTPGSSAQLAKRWGQRPRGLSLLAVGSSPRGRKLAEASW